MKQLQFTAFFIFLFLANSAFCQILERNIIWLPNKVEKINENNFELLYFSNAVYENLSTGLPYYHEQFKMITSNNNAQIEIITTNYEPVPTSQLKNILNNSSIPNEINFNSFVSFSKKKPLVELSFIPLRKNKNNGTIERLISFSFRIIENNIQNKNNKSRTYASNSVLNTGKWQKIKISQTGIFKLTYTQILEMGFQNPSKIKVYGNGGKALSVQNNIFRNDDLVENPIKFENGTDGIFNSGDYILFYAHGPVYWTYDKTRDIYFHTLHPFSDESYYFITDEGGSSKQIQTLAIETNSPNVTVNTFDDYQFHESESVNFLKSGKLWVGENFNIILSHDFGFNFPQIVPNEQVKFAAAVYGRSSVNNTFTFNIDGANVGTSTIAPTQLTSVSSNYANSDLFIKNFTSSNSNFNVSITYNKPAQGGEGWLDYIDMNVRKNLNLQGGQVQFRDIKSVAPANYAEFQISNANTNSYVWDVTNPISPYIVPTTLNGNILSFIAKTDTLHEYIVFNGTMFYNPVIVGEVANQNLHGLPATDMVIVSHPDFISYANSLAEFHRNNDNLSVLVTTPSIIYNEFSSGSPDVTAIKDFMKMLYDRAGTDTSLMPKYLLFYGDGSYDNRHNFSTNTNFI
ncbi:MAG: hypothetical protein HY951_17570, partial [Bacteroidia bacterium]|nr:hypothetical protein [Bacteroidia bacterium]